MSTAAQFKIEDGIPLTPNRGGGKQGGLAKSLREMSVGQSIFAADRTQSNVSAQASLTARLLKDGRKYTTRTVDGGVRVWRIA